MTKETKTCPFCGEEILAVAKKCKHCGEWLDKQKEEIEQTIQCPVCGEDISANATVCEHCGEQIQKESDTIRKNETNELPLELKKYNWGPLCSSFIWGFFNGMPKNILITFIVLWVCCLIPVINILTGLGSLGLQIWAGTKGNEWAWNHKKWNSVEEFNNHQVKWVIYPIAIALIIAGFIVLIAGIGILYE